MLVDIGEILKELKSNGYEFKSLNEIYLRDFGNYILKEDTHL